MYVSTMFNHLIKKIFYSLFVFCFITNYTYAQEFEELFIRKWCKCTDVAFPKDTKLAEILEEIAKTITEKDGQYHCDFEAMRAYYEEKPEARKFFEDSMQEFGGCLASDDIDLDSLDDKFPTSRKRFNKKFKKITSAILKESENCQKGQVIYLLWLDGAIKKYNK